MTLVGVMTDINRCVETKVLTPNEARRVIRATADAVGLSSIGEIFQGDIPGGAFPLIKSATTV